MSQTTQQINTSDSNTVAALTCCPFLEGQVLAESLPGEEQGQPLPEAAAVTSPGPFSLGPSSTLSCQGPGCSSRSRSRVYREQSWVPVQLSLPPSTLWLLPGSAKSFQSYSNPKGILVVQAGWQVPTCHLERLRLARDLSCDSEVAGVRPAWLLLPRSADSPVEKLLVQDLFLQYPPSSECGTVRTGLFHPPASEPERPTATGMAQGFSSRDHSDISTNTIYSIFSTQRA